MVAMVPRAPKLVKNYVVCALPKIYKALDISSGYCVAKLTKHGYI